MTKTPISPTPILRFPGFNGDWTERKAGTYFASSRKKGSEGLPIYSVTQNDGLVRRDSLDRQIGVDAGFEQNLRAEKDDLVYNMMRMWQGAIGKAIEPCMVSPAYVVLSPRKIANSQFFIYMFNRKRALYLLWAYSYGLTNDRLRLYYKDFAQIPFYAPEVKEQEKIATFLGTVEQKISQLEKKRELLTHYKKGVMQQIFTQQIRFREDDGKDFPDWEEKKLGDFCRLFKGKGISRGELDAGGTLACITYGELYTMYGAVIESADSRTCVRPSELVLSKAGDVIIPASGESAIDIATCACVLKDGVALGGDLNIIRGDFDGRFLSYYLRSAMKLALARLAQGVSVVHLYGAQLKLLRLKIPASRIEQEKIADFLIKLDRKISQVRVEIMVMQDFKKGLLQRMFV